MSDGRTGAEIAGHKIAMCPAFSASVYGLELSKELETCNSMLTWIGEEVTSMERQRRTVRPTDVGLAFGTWYEYLQVTYPIVFAKYEGKAFSAPRVLLMIGDPFMTLIGDKPSLKNKYLDRYGNFISELCLGM